MAWRAGEYIVRISYRIVTVVLYYEILKIYS